MRYIWRGTSGNVPALGDVENGRPVEIADRELADKLRDEGKIEEEAKPRSTRSRGGE